MHALDDAALVRAIPNEITASQDTMARIWPTYDRVIRRLARRLSSNRDDEDDLFQEGYLALVEAVNRFDRTKGSRLFPFAFSYIAGRMRRWLRAEAKHRTGNGVSRPQLVSLSSAVNGVADGSHDLVVEDVVGHKGVLGSPFDSADSKSTLKKVTSGIPRLSPRQAQVLHLRLCEDQRPSEIARRLHISQPRVTRLIQDGVGKLRAMIRYAA